VLGTTLAPALVLALTLALVAAVAPAGATTLDAGRSSAGGSSASGARTLVVLDGVRVWLPDGGRQVVTVNHTSGTRARVALWRQEGGTWRLLGRTTAGRIGYGGLVAARLRRQATGTTPLGTFRLLSAFGTHVPAAGWDLPYRTIRSGDYWVEDNASAYYNRYRNKAEGGFRWSLPSSDDNSSERLSDFALQYEYAIVTGFNYAAQVRHRGAGIFLHVNGSGATAGCVSAPRWFLRRAFAALDPAQRPVIAIGR
jgi:L,D-peptidoglycan transpeptidase YkuD (ErfK/YbiS/YcfS/YnhG family)